ncbi:MAG: hypothetical protein LBL60_01355 [Mycoplasmataceae bacterium]|nr:hypothetical protein [Mycoplasmataceae bacterium]
MDERTEKLLEQKRNLYEQESAFVNKINFTEKHRSLKQLWNWIIATIGQCSSDKKWFYLNRCFTLAHLCLDEIYENYASKEQLEEFKKRQDSINKIDKETLEEMK